MNTEQELSIKLNWLYKIRLVTNFSAIFVFFLSFSLLRLDLSVWPIICLFCIGLVSNEMFRYYCSADNLRYQQLISFILIFDVLWLSLSLYFYGGYTNPFSVLFLFYISLAAIFLNRKWTWVIYIISLFLYASLFFFYQPVDELGMHEHHHYGHSAGFSLHLQGMYLSFVLIGAILSFFLSRMAEEVQNSAELSKILKSKQAEENKLLALASLTAGAAHELSTPLATIKLINENLLETYSDKPELISEIRQIENEITRCEKVLNRMRLKGFDLPGQVLSSVSVNQICQQLKQEFETYPGKIEFINFDHDLAIKTLPDSLIESLTAMIKNALEASDFKQKVYVECQKEGSFCCFTVKDTAGGIDPSIVSRIGDPFVSSKDYGMGLGLFLVKLFAKRTGARLDIESNEKGSTLSLIMPC